MGIFSGHESVNRELGSGGDTDRPPRSTARAFLLHPRPRNSPLRSLGSSTQSVGGHRGIKPFPSILRARARVRWLPHRMNSGADHSAVPNRQFPPLCGSAISVLHTFF